MLREIIGADIGDGEPAFVPIERFPAEAGPADQTLWIVADPVDEAARLQALRQACPAGRRLAGLGADLLPALVTWNTDALTSPPPAPPDTITLLLATPRSGSSVVADILGHVTGTRTREHLRKDAIAAMAGGYAIDRAAVLHRTLRLIGNPATGQATTKIISHFLQDYVAEVGDLMALKTAARGSAIRVIILDRTDHVAQAVSGYLALNRGVWHRDRTQTGTAADPAGAVDYDFESLLQLYLFYRQQSSLLAYAREIFPDHLSLEYGADVAAGDVTALGTRIAAFLGQRWVPDPDATARAKLADAENDRLCAQFRADYRADYRALFDATP